MWLEFFSYLRNSPTQQHKNEKSKRIHVNFVCKRQKQQKSPEFFDRAADESLKSSNDSMVRKDLGGT